MGKLSLKMVLLLALVTPQVQGCGKNEKKTKSLANAGSLDTSSKKKTLNATVVTVEIVAAPASPLDQGASFQFAALVKGGTDLDVVWSASDGTIDANGFFVAPAQGGQVIVTATSAADAESSASETITINNVTVSATGPAGLFNTGTASYTATVGGTVLNKTVTWRLSGSGDLGSIDSSGHYTPTMTRGGYTVTIVATSVADPTKSASVVVSVTASTIGIQSIQPGALTVFTNESAQLSVQAVGVSNDVSWSVASADGGSITAEGLYTAPATVGTYTVSAQSTAVPSITGSATITVALRPYITIDASSVNLLPGGTATFSAGVTNGTAGITWSADCGTIDASGNYTAPSTPGICHITVTSVEFPWVSVTIEVAVCTAFDKVLTYANPGTTPTDTSDDVIGSRVRLALAAAAVMFTTYDTFDAAWLTITADPLATARTYSGPGADGKWGTVDDDVAAFYSVMTDAGGLQTGYALQGTAGADGIYGTPDDEILEFVTYARNGAGLVTEATHAVTAGTDALWGTADDGIGSFDTFEYDANNTLVEFDQLNPNRKTHSYATYQNDAYGRPVTVTNYVNPGVTNVWYDGDDTYNRQWLYSYDGAGRPSIIVEKVFVGQASNPQPQNDSDVLYTYAGDARIPVSMDQYRTGSDKTIGTGDDVLSVYAKASDVCPW